MTTGTISREAELAFIYFGIAEDMMEEFDENAVWVEVVERYFYPCSENCGEVIYMVPDKDGAFICQHCGERYFEQ